MVDNIVEVEGASILQSFVGGPADSALGVSCALRFVFHFMAAFPSVARKWIMACLEVSGAPAYVMNRVRGLYSNCEAFC